MQSRACPHSRTLGALTLALTFVFAAPSVLAQAKPDAWKAVTDKARGQTLVIMNQGNKAFDAMLEVFSKKYGIKVEATVARPSTALARIKTEQSNGQHLWDVWWSITSNMVNVASPAGMLSRFEEYVMLPEVRSPAQWRHPDYIYGDKGRTVFTYSHELNVGTIRNRDVLPEVKGDTLGMLLDPRMKGRIVLRDASEPNAGAFNLSPLLKLKGPDYVRTFLRDMQPRIFANPQQLDTAIMRGGAALAVGMQYTSLSACLKAGGCKNLEERSDVAYTLSRGFAIFKNPPHPEATRVFVNWALSKEGQDLYVREWARHNESGAVSHRKDVPPHPDHTRDLPDFANASQYVWTSTYQGSQEIEDVVRIFRAYAK